MKLTKTANTKLKPGMTLIEITVVILVLLTLISVLFIGANIYKKGADRAACILNIRNVHQAVRANQNLQGKNTSDPLVRTDIIGTGKYLEAEPACPTSTQIVIDSDDATNSVFDYVLSTTYPEVGTVAAVCDQYGEDGGGDVTDHVPANVSGW